MSFRTPKQITEFIKANQYRMDNPVQFFGDEPNSYRRDWDKSRIRFCLFTTWTYDQSAGNQAIPLVYKTVNEHNENFLADRSYFYSTPRDLKVFEKNGIPVFGIESKHQLMDFDVVGTSISYPVLSINFVKQLMMSDLPPSWADLEVDGKTVPGRHREPEKWPMVLVGGQCYGAPEVVANVADAVFCGEVEDEPGNPGIGAMFDRIDEFKQQGLWSTDRMECYKRLALEFNWLYFPCFVDVHYGYEERPSVAAFNKELEVEQTYPSKQVIGYSSNLPGLRMPFIKRFVSDLNAVKPLDNPPLLYVDPGMGAGDAEAQRGCPAWAINADSLVQTLRGTIKAREVSVGDAIKSSSDYREVTHVFPIRAHESVVVKTKQGVNLSLTPEHEVWAIRNRDWPKVNRRKTQRNADREWVRADKLEPGDFIEQHYGNHVWPSSYVGLVDEKIAGQDKANYPTQLTEELGWLLGMIAGDSYVRAHTVEFRVENDAPGVAERLKEVVSLLFDGRELTSHVTPNSLGVTFTFSSYRFVRWLKKNFGIEANDTKTRKDVYSAVFRSPRSVVVEFMSALYDCNGSHRIPKSDTAVSTIEYVVCDEKQARKIATVLLMLGLPPVVRSEARNVKRDGSPSAQTTYKWEVRHRAALDGDYTWLNSRHPHKSRNLDNWRAPLKNSSADESLALLEIVSVDEGPIIETIDLTVPGDCEVCSGGSADRRDGRNSHSFNSDGVLVANCNFCALTYRQKPYRQRDVDYMVNFTKDLVQNTGALHVSPFGPDFPMHTEKKRLIKGILENVTDDVDASSMRVDDFIADPSYILLQAHGGMDTVTLGVEGNSQRMRDLVGKGAADEDIIEAVARGIRAGLQRFKLYMIASLPGEDEGDIYKIMTLAKKLADVRDSMGSKARIQFSWTPMLIEGNTPFQWFSPTSPNYALGDVFQEFRDLRIDFKLGGKAQKDKLGYFQLTQRASREVGKAMIEAVVSMGVGCWGGAPKGLYEAVDANLKHHGFLNGFADCYDERRKHDMFGWEMIDQGINVELLWVTYQQMMEFLERTDSKTYDSNFRDDYHGNEWIERCDTKCMGKSCGVCSAEDLRIRRGYIQGAANEVTIDLSQVKVVDQRSVAMKIRAKIVKADDKRFVMNDHFRYAMRRAANRAGMPHAKRSWRFSSDAVKHKDWTSGVDYVEWGVTKRLGKASVAKLVETMNSELESVQIVDWVLYPSTADALRTDVDLSLYEMELDVSPSAAQIAIDNWNAADYIKMIFKEDGYSQGMVLEEVNGKDYVDDLWLTKDGHRLFLSMLVRGKATPYLVYAGLFNKASWVEAAQYPAIRIDAFIEQDNSKIDFFRPACLDCDNPVPVNAIDKPYDLQYCPRCKDRANNRIVELSNV